MKLSTVNPQLDFSTLSTLLHKDVSSNYLISRALALWNDMPLNMLFPLYVQMHQALGPSSSPVFPLESAGGVFPFSDQADLFQSFGSGPMDNQCSMGLLDMAPHAAPYAFEKQVIVASKNYIVLFAVPK
jgi:hypothetical protein